MAENRWNNDDFEASADLWRTVLFWSGGSKESAQDAPEGWSGMADTTVTHQPATESTCRTPISGMRDTWLDSQGDASKGSREQTERATSDDTEMAEPALP
ncbi:unnamed protein product [Boreogadus saida]